jgi:cytochrome c
MKALAILVVTATLAQLATANPELAQRKNCLACHSLDQKIVGPAYRDVAAKYSGQDDALDRLAAKVQKGGTGVWGTAVMPPNPVTPDEARTLVSWILSLKRK